MNKNYKFICPCCGEEADLLFFDESKSVAQVNELDIIGGTAVPIKTTDCTGFLNGRQWYECDECGADFDQFELAELKDGEYLTFVECHEI